MASLKKFPQSAIVNELRHVARTIKNDANRDIDPSLSYLNFSLTPEHPLIVNPKTKIVREMTDYEYFKTRTKELYCFKRSDVKKMAGWVITAPHDLSSKNERSFFASVYRFLRDLYGIENIVACYVHYDEGKREKIITWHGPLADENGNIKTRFVAGRPHMHFYFIPVVPDNRHEQGYKICANDLLNRSHLLRFHSDLEHHLRADGIYCSIRSGVTKAQGRNYSVAEMKRQYDFSFELPNYLNDELPYA